MAGPRSGPTARAVTTETRYKVEAPRNLVVLIGITLGSLISLENVVFI